MSPTRASSVPRARGDAPVTPIPRPLPPRSPRSLRSPDPRAGPRASGTGRTPAARSTTTTMTTTRRTRYTDTESDPRETSRCARALPPVTFFFPFEAKESLEGCPLPRGGPPTRRSPLPPPDLHRSPTQDDDYDEEDGRGPGPSGRTNGARRAPRASEPPAGLSSHRPEPTAPFSAGRNTRLPAPSDSSVTFITRSFPSLERIFQGQHREGLARGRRSGQGRRRRARRRPRVRVERHDGCALRRPSERRTEEEARGTRPRRTRRGAWRRRRKPRPATRCVARLSAGCTSRERVDAG